MNTAVDHEFLRRLRHLGFAEGVSTLVLFGVAMPLKHAWDMPLAVSIVGALHGFLFVALVAMLFVAADRVPIGRRLAVVGALAAVVPFGPFVFDRRLARLAE
jgi:integral membrane protein